MVLKNICLFFTLIIMFSCKEKVIVTSEQLDGKWIVTKAIRNNKETKTLQSSYFMFSPDNSINTNFPSIEETTTFTIVEDKLQIGGNPPMNFLLQEFSNDSMKWSGKINEIKLELFLKKE